MILPSAAWDGSKLAASALEELLLWRSAASVSDEMRGTRRCMAAVGSVGVGTVPASKEITQVRHLQQKGLYFTFALASALFTSSRQIWRRDALPACALLCRSKCLATTDLGDACPACPCFKIRKIKTQKLAYDWPEYCNAPSKFNASQVCIYM